MRRYAVPALLIASALAACGGREGSPEFRHLPASVATPPLDASLLRVIHAGGTAELLRATTLTPREWVITGGLPTITRLLGAVPEARTVYGLDNAGHLIAIDMQARRWHAVPTTAKQFVTTPDGTILGVDTAGHVLRMGARGLSPLKAVVDRGAVLLRGPGDDVITVGNRPDMLDVFGATGEVRHLAVPTGRITTTWIGDLVAVVTDSGVTFVDPTGRVERGRKAAAEHTIRIRNTPTVATFSPSGHRLYVGRKSGGLVMIDRFTRKALSELPLPGPVDALRVDRSGRWLLASGPGHALWVIDLARWALASTRLAPWSENLPQVIDGRTLLVRSNADLVAVDLTQDTNHNLGVLLGGAADRYLMLPWIVEQPATTALATTPAAAPAPATSAAPVPAASQGATTAPAAGQTVPAAPAPAVAGQVYLQVSSSQNADWAKAFAQQLKDGGFPAKVLDPGTPTEGYRVVVGPYSNRVDADSVGKRLGRSYFIITPTSGDP